MHANSHGHHIAPRLLYLPMSRKESERQQATRHLPTLLALQASVSNPSWAPLSCIGIFFLLNRRIAGYTMSLFYSYVQGQVPERLPPASVKHTSAAINPGRLSINHPLHPLFPPPRPCVLAVLHSIRYVSRAGCSSGHPQPPILYYCPLGLWVYRRTACSSGW